MNNLFLNIYFLEKFYDSDIMKFEVLLVLMKVCYGVNFSVYGYLFFLEEVMVIVKGYFCYFVNVFIGYSVEGYYCFMYNYVVSI